MHNNQSVVAIIPARKGSSGCPGKNFRPIAGKPLVMWSVEAALQSDGVDIVVISTNDENVIEIVKSHPEYGESVLIVERPESLSGPTAKTEWAMAHTLHCLKNEYKLRFDVTVLLQPTSPARRNKLIDACLVKMFDGGFDSVLTVTEETPFFWKLEPQKQGLVNIGVSKSEPQFYLDEAQTSPVRWFRAFHPNDYRQKEFQRLKIESVKEPLRLRAVPNYSIFDRPMRQQVEAENKMVFHDNGNVYCCNSEVIFELGQRTGYNPALVVTPFFENLQIDTEEDFAVMSKLVELYGSFL
jgi:CMP-N-acetylneuraminic acid synthetase